MGEVVIGHLVADAGRQAHGAPVGQLGVEFAGEAQQDVALLAPVVGDVTRGVLDEPHADIAELARGKSARVIGNLMALLTLLKGLPMTYNRDLQEDKERLFDTSDTVRATVRIVAVMLRNTTVNAKACETASKDAALLATDLADYLVRKGVAFRQAHHIVGAAVVHAERARKALDKLTVKDLQSIDKNFGEDAREIFDLCKAMDRRNLPGAPGTDEVKRQLARWRRALAETG